jgi:hypothetical protein
MMSAVGACQWMPAMLPALVVTAVVCRQGTTLNDEPGYHLKKKRHEFDPAHVFEINL